MTIDWSKAPEGTTHCNQHNGVWIKLLSPDGGQYQAWINGCWEMGFGHMNNSYHKRPAKAVIEWNGEGLPPEGAELEAGFACEDFEKWHKGVCIAVGECPEGREEFCVVRFGKKIAMYTMDHGRMRPIRTAEQIEADQKNQEIQELMIVLGSVESAAYKDIAIAIQQADFRKQVSQ